MNKKVKIVLSVLTLALILISVPVGVYLVKQRQEIRKRAAADTNIWLEPATGLSASPGDSFYLNVQIDTGENEVGAVDVTITYDGTILLATRVDQGPFLSDYKIPSDFTVPGEVRFVYYNKENLGPKQSAGTENLAIVHLDVLDGANPSLTDITTVVDIPLSESGASASDPDAPHLPGEPPPVVNVLAGTGSATITISGGGSLPTSTPTLSPSPTPTPENGDNGDDDGGDDDGDDDGDTPTPTPTSSSGGAATATPTLAPAEIPESGILAPSLVLTLGGGVLLILGFFALLLL